MNFNKFGHHIACLLTQELLDIDSQTVNKINKARERAIASLIDRSSEHAFSRVRWNRLSIWVSALGLFIGIGVGLYYHKTKSPMEEVDVMLLAGDLPIKAYIDKDFDQWLDAAASKKTHAHLP